jgi:hypothetical protein
MNKYKSIIAYLGQGKKYSTDWIYNPVKEVNKPIDGSFYVFDGTDTDADGRTGMHTSSYLGSRSGGGDSMAVSFLSGSFDARSFSPNGECDLYYNRKLDCAVFVFRENKDITINLVNKLLNSISNNYFEMLKSIGAKKDVPIGDLISGKYLNKSAYFGQRRDENIKKNLDNRFVTDCVVYEDDGDGGDYRWNIQMLKALGDINIVVKDDESEEIALTNPARWGYLYTGMDDKMHLGDVNKINTIQRLSPESNAIWDRRRQIMLFLEDGIDISSIDLYELAQDVDGKLGTNSH